MKRLILSLLPLLALAASPLPQSVHAAPVHGPVQLELLDRDEDEVLAAYSHRGQFWVAGERGHRYAVRLRNTSNERVLVVLSVDGINAISGEDAAPEQTGYVLGPWQSTDIPGWRKSNDEVAQFVFSSPRVSYGARTGRADNLGVVGIAVFNERAPVRPLPTRSRPLASAQGQRRSMTAPAAEASSDAAAPPPPSAPAPVAQRLGTGHGEREASSVRNTHFERATRAPSQISELRYDSARNLRARGIVLRPTRVDPRAPQAFPQRFVPDPPRR